MKNLLTKSYLLIAGFLMVMVGVYIAITTAAYVTTMTTQDTALSINMLSDLRGMGGMLLIVGTYVLASAFRRSWQQPALVLSVGVYATFVAFRSLGIFLDGLPGMEILIAYSIELVMAVLGILLGSGQSFESAEGNLGSPDRSTNWSK